MSSTNFEFLLNKISPKIQNKDTKLRKAIPAKERLALPLRFLTTGDSYVSKEWLFKILKQVISTIIPEVCLAHYVNITFFDSDGFLPIRLFPAERFLEIINFFFASKNDTSK